jgi:hypothetical protein
VQQVARTFAEQMRRRGHYGELHFVDAASDRATDKGELRVMVAPDRIQRFGDLSQGMTQTGGTEAKALQNVATLSGGEKSVSALVLLGSIARHSVTPFRICDEFDVFQGEYAGRVGGGGGPGFWLVHSLTPPSPRRVSADEASRRSSTMMLLEWSKVPGPDGRVPQFMLLTPHDVAAAVSSFKTASDARSAGGGGVGGGAGTLEPKVVRLQAAARAGAGAPAAADGDA